MKIYLEIFAFLICALKDSFGESWGIVSEPWGIVAEPLRVSANPLDNFLRSSRSMQYENSTGFVVHGETMRNDFGNITVEQFKSLYPVDFHFIPAEILSKMSGKTVAGIMSLYGNDSSLATKLISSLKSEERISFLENLSNTRFSEEIEDILGRELMEWVQNENWNITSNVSFGQEIFLHLPPEFLLNHDVDKSLYKLRLLVRSLKSRDLENSLRTHSAAVKRLWTYLVMQDSHLIDHMALKKSEKLMNFVLSSINLEELTTLDFGLNESRKLMTSKSWHPFVARRLFAITRDNAENSAISQEYASNLAPRQIKDIDISRIIWLSDFYNLNFTPLTRSALFEKLKSHLYNLKINGSISEIKKYKKILFGFLDSSSLSELKNLCDHPLNVEEFNVPFNRLTQIQAYYVASCGKLVEDLDFAYENLRSMRSVLSAIPASRLLYNVIPEELSSESINFLLARYPPENIIGSATFLQIYRSSIATDKNFADHFMLNMNGGMLSLLSPMEIVQILPQLTSKNVDQTLDRKLASLPPHLASILLSKFDPLDWSQFEEHSFLKNLLVKGLTCPVIKKIKIRDFLSIFELYNRMRIEQKLDFPRSILKCCQVALREYLNLKAGMVNGSSVLNENLTAYLDRSDIRAVRGYLLATLPVNDTLSSKFRDDIISEIGRLSLPELLVVTPREHLTDLTEMYLEIESKSAITGIEILTRLRNLIHFIPATKLGDIAPKDFKFIMESHLIDTRICAPSSHLEIWSRLMKSAFGSVESITADVILTLSDSLLAYTYQELNSINSTEIELVADLIKTRYGERAFAQNKEITSFTELCARTMSENEAIIYSNRVSDLIVFYLNAIENQISNFAPIKSVDLGNLVDVLHDIKQAYSEDVLSNQKTTNKELEKNLAVTFNADDELMKKGSSETTETIAISTTSTLPKNIYHSEKSEENYFTSTTPQHGLIFPFDNSKDHDSIERNLESDITSNNFTESNIADLYSTGKNMELSKTSNNSTKSNTDESSETSNTSSEYRVLLVTSTETKMSSNSFETTTTQNISLNSSINYDEITKLNNNYDETTELNNVSTSPKELSTLKENLSDHTVFSTGFPTLTAVYDGYNYENNDNSTERNDEFNLSVTTVEDERLVANFTSSTPKTRLSIFGFFDVFFDSNQEKSSVTPTEIASTTSSMPDISEMITERRNESENSFTILVDEKIQSENVSSNLRELENQTSTSVRQLNYENQVDTRDSHIVNKSEVFSNSHNGSSSSMSGIHSESDFHKVHDPLDNSYESYYESLNLTQASANTDSELTTPSEKSGFNVTTPSEYSDFGFTTLSGNSNVNLTTQCRKSDSNVTSGNSNLYFTAPCGNPNSNDKTQSANTRPSENSDFDIITESGYSYFNLTTPCGKSDSNVTCRNSNLDFITPSGNPDYKGTASSANYDFNFTSSENSDFNVTTLRGTSGVNLTTPTVNPIYDTLIKLESTTLKNMPTASVVNYNNKTVLYSFKPLPILEINLNSDDFTSSTSGNINEAQNGSYKLTAPYAFHKNESVGNETITSATASHELLNYASNNETSNFIMGRNSLASEDLTNFKVNKANDDNFNATSEVTNNENKIFKSTTGINDVARNSDNHDFWSKGKSKIVSSTTESPFNENLNMVLRFLFPTHARQNSIGISKSTAEIDLVEGRNAAESADIVANKIASTTVTTSSRRLCKRKRTFQKLNSLKTNFTVSVNARHKRDISSKIEISCGALKTLGISSELAMSRISMNAEEIANCVELIASMNIDEGTLRNILSSTNFENLSQNENLALYKSFGSLLKIVNSSDIQNLNMTFSNEWALEAIHSLFAHVTDAELRKEIFYKILRKSNNGDWSNEQLPPSVLMAFGEMICDRNEMPSVRVLFRDPSSFVQSWTIFRDFRNCSVECRADLASVAKHYFDAPSVWSEETVSTFEPLIPGISEHDWDEILRTNSSLTFMRSLTPNTAKCLQPFQIKSLSDKHLAELSYEVLESFTVDQKLFFNNISKAETVHRDIILNTTVIHKPETAASSPKNSGKPRIASAISSINLFIIAILILYF